MPVYVSPPGFFVTVHVPEGSPLSTTLPVATLHVGWVTVPATGASGGMQGDVATMLNQRVSPISKIKSFS